MTYVFVVLMSVFTGAYIYFKRSGPLVTRLFFKAAASVMLILVAVSARIGADEPYYTIIVIGLSFALSGDILLLFTDFSPAYLKAGMAAHTITLAAYITAFWKIAAPAWYDGVFFLLLMGVGMLAKKITGTGKISVQTIVYTVFLCVMAARAFSMLFAPKTNAAFSICAAIGGFLLTISDTLPAFEKLGNSFGRAAGTLSTAAYYSGQALIALTVML